MGEGLHKRWLTGLVTVAAFCFTCVFVVDGVSTSFTRPAAALSDALLLDRRVSGVEASSRTEERRSKSSARQLAEQILARNIFDAQTGPLSWDPPLELPPPREPEPPVSAAADAPTPRCDARLRLVASVVHAARPERSLAALRLDGRTHLLAPGARLGDLTLAVLQPSYAYLQSANGAWCSLTVFGSGERASSETKPVAPAPSAPQSKAKSSAYFSKEELADGVRTLGPHSYAVSRELVSRALRDPGKAAAGAQFRPVHRQNHGEGMEIRAVRGDTLLQRIGIRAGDVVRSVNGAELTTPTGLLSGLRALREDDTVTLELVRDNAVQKVQYLFD